MTISAAGRMTARSIGCTTRSTCNAASRPGARPGDGAFDDPALGQHHEFARVTAPHDLDVHLSAGTGQALLELRPLLARVGVELQQEGIQPQQRRHHQNLAIAILDIGGMHDRVHQQALPVDQDVPLLPLDLFATIEAWRIDAAPPFSGLLTLWLSMMAAVGLASRSACSPHST